ncbi:MAG: DUF169 domain-containing protein [Candidatus Poseidoniia archaeon]|nr:DUF169 domain-containing protein [Candidatus Poseidoniia archaeon]
MSAATHLVELLELERHPVAVAFLDTPPKDLPRVEQMVAAGCGYWKRAAAGEAFYTEATDHYGCPIGAHTHGIGLPEEQGAELEDVIGTMVKLEYLEMQEVAEIPRREEPFNVVGYAPLVETTFEPDVVLVRGNTRQIMVLAEAAHAAGVTCQSSMVGRPTCAAIPEVIQSGLSATNLGCIGNRVYTELGDGELYFAFAGLQLEDIVKRLSVIVNANKQLETYHRERVS